MTLPLGELLDLLTAAAVRSGRSRLKSDEKTDNEEFWNLLERR